MGGVAEGDGKGAERTDRREGWEREGRGRGEGSDGEGREKKWHREEVVGSV